MVGPEFLGSIFALPINRDIKNSQITSLATSNLTLIKNLSTHCLTEKLRRGLLEFQHLKYFIISFLFITVNFQKAQGQSSLGYVEGDVIVKFKDSFDVSARQGISGDSDVLTLQGVSKSVNLRLESSFNNFSIQHYSGVGGEQSTEEIIEQVQGHPGIEYIEPNYIISKTSADVDSQDSQNPDSIFAREAYNALQAVSSDPITFAVLDTGVDVTHTDLQSIIWENRNELPNDGIDNDGNGFIDDINGWNFANNNADLSDCDGHGTHVSGIIQQTVTNGSSLDDASLPFRIMGLKFLGCDGIGSTSNAINAIDYAIDNGARVLNNSWGNDSYSNALHEAVVRSYNAGTVFVAAAGNNASDNDITPFYPASYPVPHVISVAATTFNDGFAESFSNFGLQSVHIGAPGVGVQSAYPNDQNVRLSGTSMATPFVAAVTGLMLNERPELNGYQVKQILLESAQAIASLTDYVEGQRRLHALQAVLAAQNANPDSNMPEYNRHVFSSEVAGGCGLVHKMYSEMHRIQSKKNAPKNRGGHLPKALFGLMLALPLMVWTYLKQRAMKSSKRKYERYQVDIPLHIAVDNHFVSAHLFSISQGGAGISIGKSTHLKKGSQIDLLLSAHNENVTISGRVVWMSNNKVGIQFRQKANWIKQLFSVWNLSLVKDS